MVIGIPGQEYDRGSKVTGEREFDVEYPEEDVESSGLCCLQGCLAGAGIGALFIIILPAGVLLTFYGSNNSLGTIMALGIVLMTAPIFSLPVILVVYYNRRRIRKFGKSKVSDISELQRF